MAKTVGELMDELAQFPRDTDIIIDNRRVAGVEYWGDSITFVLSNECIACNGTGDDWDTKTFYGQMTRFDCNDCAGTGKIATS